MYDVIVIGGGPAGLSAAINVRQRGGSVLVATLPMENNPLAKAERVDNYPGFYHVTGTQILESFYRHAEDMGVEFLEGRVLNAYYTGKNWMLSIGSDVKEALALVFAGGITRGKPFPGETEHLGAGVSYCATCDGMLYRGKEVAVLGFGPADKKEAEFLESIGCHVQYFDKPREVIIEGNGPVDSVTIDGEKISVSCVFILRPSLAPTSLFPGIELEGQYICVDREMKTNLDGLYAAGDCTGTPLQIAKAAGEGMTAGQKAMAYAVKIKKENN